MDWSTWVDALRVAANYGEHIAIGGGEPTCHPDFKRMVRLALEHGDIESVWLATNGKKTKTALWILRKIERLQDWGEEHKFSADLSRDPWHDPIDPKVVQAFGKNIRDVSKSFRGLMNHGRAKENQMAPEENDCLCEGLHVKPSGTVHICGCPEAPAIGHVRDFDLDDSLDPCDCYKNQTGVTNATLARAFGLAEPINVESLNL